MRPKIPCEKCGSRNKVRKLTGQDVWWCFECRDVRDRSPRTLAEAQRRYEKNGKHPSAKSTRPDFDKLLAQFQNDCQSFTSIASEFNLSREGVRQLYQKYFSQVVPRRPNGRTRRKICTIKRRIVKVKNSFSSDSRYASLLNRSAEQGMVAKPALTSGGQKHSAHQFFLNGKVCKLLVIAVPRKIYDRSYFSFHTPNLEGIEFLILQAGEVDPKFFVLPRIKVEERRNINIPADFQWSEYNNVCKSRLRIDWLQFREAWHLLKDARSDSVA